PKVNKPFKQFLANRVQYQLQKYAFKKADTIIAQTLQSKEFITKEFSVSEQKINVVPNAIVVAKREKPKSPKKSSLIKILCFGLFDELNGIPFLIDVITKNKFSHIEFVFAGFGKYTKEVEMLASTRDNVTYLGQLPYKDMMAKLPEHEFLIIPRLNTLGAQLYIPTKLLEGMYMGVVPICSDVEGMTCVVDHDEDGLVFKAAEEDGLVKILNNLVSIDDEMYLKLRYHAQQKVSENYTWESNFEYLKQIYSKCIN
ncbi:MAG: glycosyltransferase family 4 protein, partial [Flavobacteriaceae bacterium]